jgi:hypothetical protein
VHGRVVVLYAAVAAAAEQFAVAAEQGTADGDAALGESGARLLDRDREPGAGVVRGPRRPGRERDRMNSR